MSAETWDVHTHTLNREAGCLTLVLHFLRSVSRLSDPLELSRAKLFPSVAAACQAVARLVQDCPENQRRLAGGAGDDLDPVLFKLLEMDGEMGWHIMQAL